MNFSDALVMLKAGYALRRAAWKPNKWVELREATDSSMSYLELRYTDGRRAPWGVTRCDLLEEDWQLR